MMYFLEQMIKILEYMWMLGAFGSVGFMRFIWELGTRCSGS